MNISIILKELAKVGVVALTEKSVETFVETKIKPIFENWGKEDSRSIELEECLSEYLVRCYAKHNIMTTIVFGRLQKTLEDLYIPLTLEEYRNKDKQWIIDENCYDILENYSRILIVDAAGMGKSTIVKYFACQGINLDKSFPIVIELRRLGKNQSILKYIQLQINSLDKNIEIEEIVDILKKGDFVIFFDGYDEIVNENKPDVLDAIQEFTGKASNTKIVITSREEDDLNSLGEYKCVNIKPLTEEEAYKLIEKYDNGGDISEKLIKKLNEDSSMDVLKEFLKNPLLVSLLYKTFEYKEEIPYKKIDFYEQVYEALFNDHDKTKGGAYVHEKKTKLDRYQFEQILRVFGFLALKEEKVQYSNQLIHQLLGQAIGRFRWLEISVADFLYDITHAVPFIQKDGNEYKWVHKSFMEYFASCFICYDNKESEEKYFEKMVSPHVGMRYYNVLVFCYELDRLNFRKYIILPYIEKYINKYKESYKNDYFKQMSENDLKLARHIISVVDDIKLVNWNTQAKKIAIIAEKEFKKKDYLEKILEISKNKYKVNSFSYEERGHVIYHFIMEEMPELYEDFTIKEVEDLEIKDDGTVSFNENIDNPLNVNKEIFSKSVNFIYSRIFYKYKKILSYMKCQKLLREIKRENNFRSNNLFDL